jgi:adenylylsulfate kinase
MKSSNVIYHQASVTRQRRNKLNEHRSVVVWFTGLSGSGKSTLAHALEEKLFQKGCKTFVLDGDNMRHGLNSNLDFSDEGRTENIRRISEVSKLMIESGLIVMTAFISPFNIDRNEARKLISNDDFIEIYCKASIEACEKRDIKGLYKKARAGEIKNYTGIDSPYEPPENPDLVINTETETLEDSVDTIFSLLESKKIIT